MIKKILFIGQLNEGSTTSLRLNSIETFFKSCEIEKVDISLEIKSTNKIFSTLGWRYNIGPMISRVNNAVRSKIKNVEYYDLIWVDKGNFLTAETTKMLRDKGIKLFHFTPDVALIKFSSRFLKKSLRYYDLCITTKSFEVDLYAELGVKELSLVTQGFDEKVHFSKCKWNERKGIIFIGLYEKYRGEIVQSIIDNTNQLVKIGGVGWSNFFKKNKGNKNLIYLGKEILGSNYSLEISKSIFGLGLLSKKFPELHTTRTFEIPACGTILVSEYNKETKNYFEDSEVLFYTTIEELIFKLNTPMEQEKIAQRGMERVLSGKYTYDLIITNIFEEYFNF